MAENPIQVAIPECAPRAGSALLAWIGRCGLHFVGWRVTGKLPEAEKLIVVAAPHRSNWDWVIGVCGLWAMRLKFSYFIKDTAMIWPLSILIRGTGGIPIDRSNPKGLIDQIIQAFRRPGKLYFAITPEGTRKEGARWKTGFLRIAYATDVPVVPMVIDYQAKEFSLHTPFELSDDIETDLDTVLNFYKPYITVSR